MQCADIKLEVRTTRGGYTRMKWDNIPPSLLNVGAKLELCGWDVLESYNFTEGHGSRDTRHSLNRGLQLRLVTKDGDIIRESPMLDDAYWNPPTKIAGYDASLQLYTESGYACARLFINKSFTDYKTCFARSWVGLYPSEGSCNTNVQGGQWQWVKQFYLRNFEGDHYVYEFKSSIALPPGSQARFFLTCKYDKLCAATALWESETCCNTGCP